MEEQDYHFSSVVVVSPVKLPSQHRRLKTALGTRNESMKYAQREKTRNSNIAARNISNTDLDGVTDSKTNSTSVKQIAKASPKR
jgi:hypothetical protein